MDDFDPSAFREAFLAANANEEFIASEFAEVIRYLMRAVSGSDTSAGVYSAAEKMKFVMDLLERAETPMTWYGLLSRAVEEIEGNIPDDPDDRKLVEAARRGTKYLVECSAGDNAARGRASRRLDEFRRAIRWSLEARGNRL